MSNVKVAFEFLDPGKPPLPGYLKTSGHIIFDVKTDFTGKVQWVKDGQ